MKRQLQQGFTLIELMIVVAIIGILAAVAIPQYQDYVTRSRWADPISQISPIKMAIAECVQMNNGSLTACDSDTELSTTVGFPMPGSLTNSTVAIGTNGVLTVSGNSTLASCTVTFTPAVGSVAVTWTSATSGTGCTKSKTGI